ncbi:EF-hand domain-containing protein [Brevundimonas staleyi]|uniref:EF-hand domain-containing protein n=1 Tax=Brevundimonas staleyi TaxID=74326 RepID=A0ABW0FVJ6_9CAUL
MKRLALVALGLVALSACASGPGGPRGPGGPPGPRPGLFVSPFGELFFSEPGQPWPVATWFTGADRDGDGRLTFEEFSADGQRQFRALDTRRDGRLTPDEISAYEIDLAEARGRLPGLQGGRGPGRPPQGFGGGGAMNLAEPAAPQQRRGGQRQRLPTGPMAYGPIAAAGFFNYPQPVKAADLDTNQTVTAEEWARATERWFMALDTDRDGVLNLATLPRTPLQQMMERGPR